MTFLDVPAVVGSADALLATAHLLIDSETTKLESDPDVVVSCGPHCNACCEHAVAVTPAEIRAIATALASMPASTQGAIVARAQEIVARVATDIPDGTDEFPRHYYALSEPCPLLIDRACAVRDVRPLVCREYLMSSAPKHCDDRTLENVVKIRRRKNVSGWFQEVSARFDDAGPRLLATALVEAAEPANQARLSGPKLARLLTAN